MILVTVGTHGEGFNRLVEACDVYASITNERVVIQRGASNYTPQNAEYFEFTDFETMKKFMKEARVVVMHAAAGSILLGLQMEKPLVLAPRRKMYQEVFDDHQLELTKALCQRGQAVECHPVSVQGLVKAINAAGTMVVHAAGPEELVINLKQHLESLPQRLKKSN